MNTILSRPIYLELALLLVVAALLGAGAGAAAARHRCFPCVAARLRVRLSSGRLLARLLVVAFGVTWSIVFGTLAIRQHLALGTHAYDLGIFDQIVWNSAHGRLFASSLMPFAPNALGNHFSPTLLLLVPLYWIWSDPRMLLIAQTALLAGAVIPIYLWAERRSGPMFAAVLAAAYFLYPALGYVNLFDFHEIAIAVPLLSLAIFCLFRQRYMPFVVLLGLALLTKEELSFLGLAAGLYMALFQKRWKLGLIVSGVSLAVGLIVILGIMPALQGRDTNIYIIRYSYLGQSKAEALRTILTRPGFILSHLFTADKVEFVLRMLVPLVLLPLVGWKVSLIALPSFAYLLLSDDPNTVAIVYQYPAVLIVPLFFAASEGSRRLIARWPSARTGLAVALLVVGLGSYGLHGVGPLSRDFQPARYDASADHPRLGRAIAAAIPRQAAVSAQNNLGPHLSQRERISMFPRLADADFVLLDQKGDRFPYLGGPTDTLYSRKIAQMRTDPSWRVIAEEDGFLVFRRQPVIVPNPAFYLLGESIVLRGHQVVRQGNVLHVTLYWQADAPISRAYTVFNHLVSTTDREHIRGQRDNQPMRDTLSTTAWEPGRLVVDPYDIPLGPQVTPGDYLLEAGMYVSPDGPRLPVSDASGQRIGDSIPLARISIEP